MIALAYKTVERGDGSLPLLTPMSEVAGRLAVQEGAYHLGKARGGRGHPPLGRARRAARQPGDPRGGTVGLNALRTAVGLGADVSILDVNLDRLRHVDDLFGDRVVTLFSNSFNVGRVVERADLLIGAVLIAGARAPVLVTKAMVERMKEGAVVVDVAVDQGGCIETIRPRPCWSRSTGWAGSSTTGWRTCRPWCRAPRRSP